MNTYIPFLMSSIESKLIRIVKNFKGKKIKVVGDIILDEYIFGDVERISPEAPVPIVVVKEKKYNLGGAANVAWNIKALGGEPELYGVIGDDHSSEILLNLLDKKEIKTNGIIKAPSRPTTRKTRVIGQHQQIVRIDEETTEPIKFSQRKIILEKFLENEDFTAVIFEDYEKGTISKELVSEIVKRNKKKIITCDPKKHNFSFYKKISMLKPNRKELEFVARRELKSEADMVKEIEKLSRRLDIPLILLTLGDKGMILKDNESVYRIPSLEVEVYDVTGAGDTVIASFTLSMVSDSNPLEAALISTIAAGIEVTKLGASAVFPDELIEMINKRSSEIYRGIRKIK
ncbi:MAG: PfkB family carbohydrate kinase [Candidatus Hydrothermales bacterium]